MRRSAGAYLEDIVVSCDAIEDALAGIDLQAYLASRLIRSSVEREFLIIGEAVNVLVKLFPEIGSQITHAKFIVGFRNRLAHEYAAIDDEAVMAIAEHDVPLLRTECQTLIDRCNAQGI